MCDWDQDVFMSGWDRTYVSTNLKAGARQFDEEFFLGLNARLVEKRPELKDLSYVLIQSLLCMSLGLPDFGELEKAVASCAVGRADVVGRFFDHLTTNVTPEESRKIFLRLREAITIAFPFLGMPACIPGCYGMIGVVERKGQQYGETKVLRKSVINEDDTRKGSELRKRIYSGVGNSEIFGLMDKYFTDLFQCSTMLTWGYIIAKANDEVFEVHESHLIVAATVTALGVTRQARSHIKATIGIGNSVQTVKAMVHIISKLASWAGDPVAEPDVDELAQQIQATLHKK